MPTNVTAEYKKAEADFRRAREPQERLDCLRQMLKAIPKHKGTEHLQADIKTRIKDLTEELKGPKKGGARRGPSYTVRSDGAAQIALIGPANSGKSTLLHQLTGAKTEIGPYPFATKMPIPGMLPHEDIQFQLVDLPPIARDYMETWYTNALQNCDGALLVLDLLDPDCTDHVVAICERLAKRQVVLTEQWPGFPTPVKTVESSCEAEPDPFRVDLPTALVINKLDLLKDPSEVDALVELLDIQFPTLTLSAEKKIATEKLSPFLFQGLEIVRVYTKIPGKPVDQGTPYTVRRGDTVLDVARLIHKDIVASLKFAKVWGSGRFAGQQVGPEHVVADQDVLELHN